MVNNSWLRPTRRTLKRPPSPLEQLFLLITLLFSSALLNPSLAASLRHITATVPTAFPPYYQLNEEGQPEGFAIDIMNAVAKRADIQITYKREQSWADIFQAGREGKLELVPNIGATEERASYLNFTQPVHSFKVVLFVRKDRAHIKDLTDKRVGAVITNIGYQLITTGNQYKAIPYDSFEQAIFALLSGQIDALAYPAPVAWKQLTEIGYERAVIITGEPLAEVDRVIGIRKGDKALLTKLNSAISELKNSEEYRTINHKWFNEAPPFLTIERLLWALFGLTLLSIFSIGVWRHHLLKRYKEEIEKTVTLRTQQLSEKIEQQKRTALSLKEREQLLSFHFEYTPLAAISWDRAFRCHQWNSAAERIFGFSKEEALGRHAFDLIVPNTLHLEIDELFQALMAETGGVHSINENITKDRRVILCEWFSTVIKDSAGIPISISSLCQDITQQKLAESELLAAKVRAEESNQAKSIFLTNISHELRTPLHSILSFSELGIRKVGSSPDEKIKKYFSNIHTSGKRLHEQVNDLLDLSKLEAGKMVMVPSSNEIEEIIENCVTALAARIEKRGLTINSLFKSKLPPVECDKNCIDQVIMSILCNAVKFSPEGGEITLSGQHVEGIQISISDQGPGIPKGEEELIFQKFMQSSSNKYCTGGTGLGLAISQRIILAHSGRIWSEKSRDSGARFFFLLLLTLLAKLGISLEGLIPNNL